MEVSHEEERPKDSVSTEKCLTQKEVLFILGFHRLSKVTLLFFSYNWDCHLAFSPSS